MNGASKRIKPAALQRDILALTDHLETIALAKNLSRSKPAIAIPGGMERAASGCSPDSLSQSILVRLTPDKQRARRSDYPLYRDYYVVQTTPPGESNLTRIRE